MDNKIFLFFFSALGAFNGFLLSIYFLFFARPKHESNFFLGGLLFMLSVRIGKSVFYFFNYNMAKVYLQIGLAGCFMIGPFLFFYVKSVIEPDYKRHLWKYIIPPLFVLYLVVGYFYTYQSYPELWGDYFYRIINYQWLGFILASAYLLKGTFKKIFSQKAKLAYHEIWLLNVFFGVTIIWIAYYTSYYTSYIVGALSFSFVLYLLIYVLIAYRSKIELSPLPEKPKYANKKIEDAEAKDLLKKIEELMQEQELYKDPNLNLPKLAKQLHVSPHLLSQLLNDNLNKRFSQFINEYRVEEAKRLLKSDHNLKIEVIAEHCGFNSNSTFYTAFKKLTNTTPAKYLSNQNSV